MSARTVIKTRADGSVSLKSPDMNEFVTFIYYCPPNGGYVRQACGYDFGKRGTMPQTACKHLHHFGPTLTCPSREALPALIRSEWRARQRAARIAVVQL